MISERERQLAFHSQLAMQVLTQSNEPITSDQLSLRMVALGGVSYISKIILRF